MAARDEYSWRALAHTPNILASHPGHRGAVAEPVRDCVQGASVLVGVCSDRVKLSLKNRETPKGFCAAPPSWLSTPVCRRHSAAPPSVIVTGLPPPPRCAAEVLSSPICHRRRAASPKYYCNRSAATIPASLCVRMTGSGSETFGPTRRGSTSTNQMVSRCIGRTPGLPRQYFLRR